MPTKQPAMHTGPNNESEVNKRMPTLAILLTTVLALSTLIGVFLGFYRRGPPVTPQTQTGPPPIQHKLHPTLSHEYNAEKTFETPTATTNNDQTQANTQSETPNNEDDPVPPTSIITPAPQPAIPEPRDEPLPQETPQAPQHNEEEHAHPPTLLQKKDLEELVVELKKRGLSARAIAEQIGRSPSYVYRVLRRHGLSGASNNGSRSRSNGSSRRSTRRQRARRAAAKAAPAPA